jgi:putative toxin-antitoxin system antitoxin component (TIGR02293 family)
MAKPASRKTTVASRPKSRTTSPSASPAETEVVDPAGRAYTTILGLASARTPEIIETVRKGLPFGAFEQFVANTSISSADAAFLVSIPIRTLTRRKQEGRLHSDESDRLLRASRVMGRTIDLFEGDRGEARQWLSRPQRALGGARPFDIASTEVGALAVERLIDQLEHGIFV